MDQPWTRRSRPERLERRIEFEDYPSTSLFLEKLNSLSEETGQFPDISFGRTYVNLTIRMQTETETETEDADTVREEETRFAAAIDELL